MEGSPAEGDVSSMASLEFFPLDQFNDLPFDLLNFSDEQEIWSHAGVEQTAVGFELETEDTF